MKRQLKITTKGLTLVEVLVSLTLLSLVILYLLRMTSQAVFQAKILQTKRQMLNTSVDISGIIEDLMLSTYRDQDWNVVLRDGISVDVDTVTDTFVIGSNNPACSLTTINNIEYLTSACPSVSNFSSSLGDRFGYFVKVSANPPLYRYSVTVACRQGTNCDGARFKPIRIIRILVKD